MKFLKRLFNNNEEIKPEVKERNVLNLEIDDVITYDLEDYIVSSKIIYNDGGYKWYSYLLKGDTRSIWLSAEMDDELEVGIYEKIQTKLSTPIDKTVQVQGITYYVEEKSQARYSHYRMKNETPANGTVEYWDLESDDGQYLSIEKWGGDLEVSKGHYIKPSELKIIAGS